MNTALALILIGIFQVTSYRSVPNQTDSSPFYTSTGEKVSSDGIAISQDLLCDDCKKMHARCKYLKSNKLHYGDWLYIELVGPKRVNDVMNIRHKNRIDVWVEKLADEKEFHRRFGHIKLKVFRIKE